MSRDLGRDVPDLEKLYARKLWADFSYPNKGAGREKGPQKSTRKFVLETGRFRVQISLYDSYGRDRAPF